MNTSFEHERAILILLCLHWPQNASPLGPTRPKDPARKSRLFLVPPPPLTAGPLSQCLGPKSTILMFSSSPCMNIRSEHVPFALLWAQFCKTGTRQTLTVVHRTFLQQILTKWLTDGWNSASETGKSKWLTSSLLMFYLCVCFFLQNTRGQLSCSPGNPQWLTPSLHVIPCEALPGS